MLHLRTEEAKFTSSDGGTLTDPDHRNKMLSNFMAPQTLLLRVDAQVMLIKNVDEQLVNGTMGRVTRFVDPTTYGAETGYDIVNGAGATNAIPKKSAANNLVYPEVEFSLANGGKRKVLVSPETWKVELPSGEVQVSRTQVLSRFCLLGCNLLTSCGEVSADSCVGNEYPQITGADAGPCQG
jgi:ATP-dependent DNA helicase PIF1